jgi:hypothetical protein
MVFLPKPSGLRHSSNKSGGGFENFEQHENDTESTTNATGEGPEWRFPSPFPLPFIPEHNAHARANNGDAHTRTNKAAHTSINANINTHRPRYRSALSIRSRTRATAPSEIPEAISQHTLARYAYAATSPLYPGSVSSSSSSALSSS